MVHDDALGDEHNVGIARFKAVLRLHALKDTICSLVSVVTNPVTLDPLLMPQTLVVPFGVRGIFGAGLDPEVIVRFTSAYGAWILENWAQGATVVVGRDARISGPVCGSGHAHPSEPGYR